MSPLDARASTADITGTITGDFVPSPGTEIIISSGARLTVGEGGDVAAIPAFETTPVSAEILEFLKATGRGRFQFFGRIVAARRVASQVAASLPAVISKIQSTHDKHVADANTQSGHEARQAVHKAKMAAKRALRADPEARAAQVAALNAGPLARHRAASLHALALDFARIRGLSPSDAMLEAQRTLHGVEQSVAARARAKAVRASRTYPTAAVDAHWHRPVFGVVAVEQVAA